MSENSKDKLILPIYINEKTVIDMLAILEDGFSMVSQVTYTESSEKGDSKKGDLNISTSSTLFSKLLKVNMSGELSASKKYAENENVSKEKVHTIVSLFSKVRNYLVENKLLKTNLDISKIQIGDFIELEGELQKNPLINSFDSFLDLLRMANIFAEKSTTNSKQKDNVKKQQEDPILKQIKLFIQELKHSGTLDFILSDEKGTAILSVQEQYLSNDNISEIVGGRFKILGKVIKICKDKDEEISLLRKTSLSIISEEMIEEMFKDFKKDEMKQFNLPELKTKINGPAVIVIPIAIYA